MWDLHLFDEPFSLLYMVIGDSSSSYNYPGTQHGNAPYALKEQLKIKSNCLR